MKLETGALQSFRDDFHMTCRFALIVLLLFLLAGCGMKDIGTSVRYSIKGEHYLKVKDPSQGVESFRKEVKVNPDNALANYYFGRFLLRAGKYDAALVHLQKASSLVPENPDYHFWVGNTHGRLKQPKQELQRYEKALALDKKHLQSLIYSGNVYLAKGKYKKALNLYNSALEIWPTSASALYNRALVLAKLGRTPEEHIAWLQYLAYHPAGGMARKATEHLNNLKDFSYRNYHLGARTVTTEKISFEPFSAILDRGSFPSLELIGTVVKNMQSGTLQVVVYQKNNKKLAAQRAMAIRDFLLKKFPELATGRVQISWFAVPERNMKKKWSIDESVSFFLSAG